MLVDSHVHLHACYELDGLLHAALQNFARAATALAPAQAAPAAAAATNRVAGCLALTEIARDHVYAAIVAGEPRWRPRRWSVRATDEDAAIVCASPAGDEILMLAGSQIVTAEKLEVLALATTTRYPDGHSLDDTLAALTADGIPAVIPWGFGKWWLKRGRLLAELIERSDPRAFFLGDNGGRPVGTPLPQLFRAAARRGLRILPGTDLFPYASQQRKAGSFGFVLDAWQFNERPATELRRQLERLATSPRVYGSRANLFEFAWLQLAMNARSRLPRVA